MTRILFISHNEGKIADMKAQLEPLGYDVVSAKDLNIPEIAETGKTFRDNALLKAQAGFDATGLPCLADDSGLCVDALDGRPGVLTSRYSDARPEGAPYTSKLLDELKGIPEGQRKATFECRIAYVEAAGALVFRGSVRGSITTEDRGDDGFAYDYVFIPEGETLTFAEMGRKRKAEYSHRGRAVLAFIKHLEVTQKMGEPSNA